MAPDGKEIAVRPIDSDEWKLVDETLYVEASDLSGVSTIPVPVSSRTSP